MEGSQVLMNDMVCDQCGDYVVEDYNWCNKCSEFVEPIPEDYDPSWDRLAGERVKPNSYDGPDFRAKIEEVRSTPESVLSGECEIILENGSKKKVKDIKVGDRVIDMTGMSKTILFA